MKKILKLLDSALAVHLIRDDQKDLGFGWQKKMKEQAKLVYCVATGAWGLLIRKGANSRLFVREEGFSLDFHGSAKVFNAFMVIFRS